MNIVTLKQFADAVGYLPPKNDNGQVAAKPTGALTLADLKLKPTNDAPKGLQNAFIREQLLKDIRKFLRPLLDLKKFPVAAPKFRKDEIMRCEWAERCLQKAQRKLLSKENRSKDLEKKDVRTLLTNLRPLAEDYWGSVLKTYKKLDLALVRYGEREDHPDDGVVRSVTIPMGPTLPKKQAKFASVPTPTKGTPKLAKETPKPTKGTPKPTKGTPKPTKGTPTSSKPSTKKFASVATPTKPKSKSSILNFFSNLLSTKKTKTSSLPKTTTPKFEKALAKKVSKFASTPMKSSSGLKKTRKA